MRSTKDAVTSLLSPPVLPSPPPLLTHTWKERRWRRWWEREKDFSFRECLRQGKKGPCMQEKARQESARIGTYEEIETEQLLPPPTEGGEPTRGRLFVSSLF